MTANRRSKAKKKETVQVDKHQDLWANVCKTGENEQAFRRESYTQNESAELTLGGSSRLTP
jgi:hypothetical protein